MHRIGYEQVTGARVGKQAEWEPQNGTGGWTPIPDGVELLRTPGTSTGHRDDDPRLHIDLPNPVVQAVRYEQVAVIVHSHSARLA